MGSKQFQSKVHCRITLLHYIYFIAHNRMKVLLVCVMLIVAVSSYPTEDAKLAKLEATVQMLQQQLSEVTANVKTLESQVQSSDGYFDAGRNTDLYSNGGYIPYEYTNVLMNAELDLATGLFTCTGDEVWFFTFSAQTMSNGYVYAALYKNDQKIAGLYDDHHNENARNSMIATSVIVELKYGDTFGVKLEEGGIVGGDGDDSHYTHFTGIKIGPA